MSQILAQRKKYEPKFIVSTFKNDLTGGLFMFLGILIVKFLPFPLKVNLIIAGMIVLFGILFVIVDGFSIMHNALTFGRSLKNVSYYDSRMDEFIDVVSVKNNTAITKDGSILAYLRIIPKDLNIMSADEQKAIVSAHIQFLNSLEDDIQIVSRSVPIDLDTWIYNIHNKISVRVKDKFIEYNLRRFEDFKRFINKIISEGSVRNRVFYIVIRYHGQKTLQGLNIFKQLLFDLFGRQSSITRITIKDIHEALKEINDRVLNYSEILSRMKVDVERLNDNQILSMFSGYSNDIEGIDTNYITPMMWPSNE